MGQKLCICCKTNPQADEDLLCSNCREFVATETLRIKVQYGDMMRLLNVVRHIQLELDSVKDVIDR